MKQSRFLAAFVEEGTVAGAARAAKLDRHLHYDWLNDPKRFPRYGKQFDDAFEDACRVADERYRRERRQREDALDRVEAG